jgi:hypothetical protein
MSSGRRWFLIVPVSDDNNGDFEVRFTSDDHLIEAEDFLLDRGFALGRMFPDARLGVPELHMFCHDCGYDSKRFDAERMPKCNCIQQ